jgi:hypothetical protein
MRITGTLTTVGTITICENHPQEFQDDLVYETVNGIIITADDETLRAASNLLCTTVDIYPHPVNGLVVGECTPENYAHALARLAHAEDHLAREVRSSQVLAVKVSDLEQAYKQTCRTADMFAGQVLKLEALLAKHEADNAALKDKT